MTEPWECNRRSSSCSTTVLHTSTPQRDFYTNASYRCTHWPVGGRPQITTVSYLVQRRRRRRRRRRPWTDWSSATGARKVPHTGCRMSCEASWLCSFVSLLLLAARHSRTADWASYNAGLCGELLRRERASCPAGCNGGRQINVAERTLIRLHPTSSRPGVWRHADNRRLKG